MDKERWRARLSAMIATLKMLSPDEFFNEATLRYHDVWNELADFALAFVPDRERLQPLLDTKPVATQCWLPLDPNAIRSMDAMEIYWRLGENIADERWVDGALEGAFETGALVAALERVLAELDTFELPAS